MRKLPVFLLVIILAFSMMLTPEPAKATYVPPASPTPTCTYYGYVTNAGVKSSGVNPITIQSDHDGVGPPYRLGFLEFNITGIPANATITSVTLKMNLIQYNVGTTWKIVSMAHQPSVTAGAQVYTDVNTGATYYSWVQPNANSTVTQTLGGTAITDVTAAVSSGWFAVGLYAYNGCASGIWSEVRTPLAVAANRPVLTVTYQTPTTIHYNLSAKYENGTATTQTVTVTEVGGTTSLSVTGTPTDYYFTSQPISFSWDLGAGVSRSIFVVGPVATIVFSKPTLTSAVYSFTIQDYTASLGEADSYLEAWRTIGGTPTLIERELIFNKASTTPLTLELYAAYNILIRLPDNSTENYGYFVPTTNSPPYLTITKLTFAQMYQPVTKYVTDTIVRVNATHIRVTYNDTLLQTTNTTVIIKTRAGATVYTTIKSGNTFTVDWYNATAITDYVASYNATNTYYLWVTDSKILPGSFTPSHTLDWTTLGIPSSGLAIFLILGGFLVTSVANRDLGVLAGASIAACTDYLGMSNIGAGIIFITGVIGVLIAIRGVTR
jgi:hypothetical protein